MVVVSATITNEPTAVIYPNTVILSISVTFNLHHH